MGVASVKLELEDHGPIDLTSDDPALPDDDSIELVPSTRGGDLNLTKQCPRVANVLRAGITKALIDMIFVDAFPDALRDDVVANTLLECTEALNDQAIRSRLLSDKDYRDAMTVIVS